MKHIVVLTFALLLATFATLSESVYNYRETNAQRYAQAQTCVVEWSRNLGTVGAEKLCGAGAFQGR